MCFSYLALWSVRSWVSQTSLYDLLSYAMLLVCEFNSFFGGPKPAGALLVHFGAWSLLNKSPFKYTVKCGKASLETLLVLKMIRFPWNTWNVNKENEIFPMLLFPLNKYFLHNCHNLITISVNPLYHFFFVLPFLSKNIKAVLMNT